MCVICLSIADGAYHSQIARVSSVFVRLNVLEGDKRGTLITISEINSMSIIEAMFSREVACPPPYLFRISAYVQAKYSCSSAVCPDQIQENTDSSGFSCTTSRLRCSFHELNNNILSNGYFRVNERSSLLLQILPFEVDSDLIGSTCLLGLDSGHSGHFVTKGHGRILFLRLRFAILSWERK